jgi:hypothetical protein
MSQRKTVVVLESPDEPYGAAALLKSLQSLTIYARHPLRAIESSESAMTFIDNITSDKGSQEEKSLIHFLLSASNDNRYRP